MRLLWMTDLHLNFVPRRRFEKFLAEVAAAKPAAVLLGGDVGEADSVAGFLETLARAWQVPVYFVLGNRDFYHGSIRGVHAEIDASTRRVPALRYLSGAAPILLPGGTLCWSGRMGGGTAALVTPSVLTCV